MTAERAAEVRRAIPMPDTTDGLRTEIAATRADLADTLTALMAKTDVKARVGDELTHLRDNAVAKVRERRTTVVLVAGAVLAGVAAGVVMWLMRREGGR